MTAFALGVTTLILAETAAAEVLLATFIAAIVVVWIEVMDHLGFFRPHAGGPLPQ